MVVAGGLRPQLALAVTLETVDIDDQRLRAHLLEVYILYDGDRVVIIGGAVAAAVGDIHIVVNHLHLLGLVAYGDFARDREAEGVYLIDSPLGRVGVYQHRAHIAAHISLASVGSDIAAVRYVHLPYGYAGGRPDHFDLVAVVCDPRELRPVDPYFVALAAKVRDSVRFCI